MPRIDRKEIDPSPRPRSPTDFSDLRRRLLPHVESIVRSLDPGARLKGDELWFADPRKSRDHHRDSASINIHTGAWNARSSDQGGRDVISLVAYSKSETQTDAARTAAQIAGISVISPGQAQRSDSLGEGGCSEHDLSCHHGGALDAGANGQKVIDIERGEKAERAKANIQMLLKEYPSPVSGTVGENYFRARGIVALPSAPEARFAPALPYWDGSRDHGSYPAVLLPMLNTTTGEILNVLRIYLAPDGSGKLDLNDDDGRKLPPKKVIGRYDGCAMWFTGTSGELGEEIILCEGPEDALSLRMATGQTAVAAGSWHQLEKIAIPAGVKRIVIVPDDNSDPENPTKDNVGEKGLQRAARTFATAGFEIFVARIPDRKDPNAVLCDEGPDGGAEGLRRIIQRRVPYSTPNLEDQVSRGCHREIEQHRPIVERDVGDDQRQDANNVERDLHRLEHGEWLESARVNLTYLCPLPR